MKDKVLHFRTPKPEDPPADKLSLGEDITEFSPRLSSLAQATEVTVRGWDVKQKKAVVSSQRQVTPSGGKTAGPAATRKAFGSASVALLGQQVRALAEAGPVAQGQFGSMAMAYVEGEAMLMGLKDVASHFKVERASRV